MGWFQAIGFLAGALVGFALIRDFLAGLGQERIWSDPDLDELQDYNRDSFRALAPVIPILKEDRLGDVHSLDDSSRDGIRGRFA
jgi:hypothetical protein